MARNTAVFQNDAITENTRPQRLGASLRYGPRHYMSAYAASLRSVAPGSIFFFTLPGVPRLRRSTAGLLYGAPPGLKFRLAYARKNFPIITPSTYDFSRCLNPKNLNSANKKSGCVGRGLQLVVGVTVQAGAISLQRLTALARGDEVLLHGTLGQVAELRHEVAGVVLHV